MQQKIIFLLAIKKQPGHNVAANKLYGANTMQLTVNPATFINLFAVYELRNPQTMERLFIWWSKAPELLSFTRAYSNPAFDPSQNVTLTVLQWCKDHVEAQNAVSRIMSRDGMPALNKTVRYNRYTAVRCDQTGQIFNNQSEAARVMGVNQSRLSQHLQRKPGYKTLKGLTFSHAGFYDPAAAHVEAVQHG